jgi:hypothetical protein
MDVNYMLCNLLPNTLVRGAHLSTESKNIYTREKLESLWFMEIVSCGVNATES